MLTCTAAVENAAQNHSISGFSSPVCLPKSSCPNFLFGVFSTGGPTVIHTYTIFQKGFKQLSILTIFNFGYFQAKFLNLIINKINISMVWTIKSVQIMVPLHFFPIFSFLAKVLSFLPFDRNENIWKICKRTVTWTEINDIPEQFG